MTIKFSASAKGFFDTRVNVVIPPDAVDITDDAYAALLAAQAAGDQIQADANGNPVAVAPAAPTLAQVQAACCTQIDATADAIYIAVGGPSPGRLAEYQQAYADAQAFKTAGYAGSVPETIACWVTASGMTAQAAADNILATAVQWIAVLNGVRAARLIGKSNVNAAVTVDAAEAASAAALTSIQQVVAGGA